MDRGFSSGAARKNCGANSSARRLANETDLDNWQRLGLAIVGQAADDARKIARRGGRPIRDGRNCLHASKEELHVFFSSWWCGVLMGDMDITGPELERRCGL